MSEKLSRLEADTAVSIAVVYDSGSRGYPALSGRTRVLAGGSARRPTAGLEADDL